MKKNLTTVFAVLASVVLIAAVSGFGQSTRGGQIQFDIDEAVFSANQGFSFIEVYFAVPRDVLQHQKTITDYEANFETSVNLFAGD